MKRREVWRALKTSVPEEARLRAKQWEGRVATLFGKLRREGALMTMEQLGELVSQYPDAELDGAEFRLANDEWRTSGNDHGEHGTWHDIAQTVLADQIEDTELALPYNRMSSTLAVAVQMMPGASTEVQDVSQQIVASWEVGRRGVPVATLPAPARALSVSIENLIGEKAAPSKRGPAPQIQQKIERLTRLPKAKQKLVLEMLDGVLAQASR